MNYAGAASCQFDSAVRNIDAANDCRPQRSRRYPCSGRGRYLQVRPILFSAFSRLRFVSSPGNRRTEEFRLITEGERTV